MTNDLDDAAYQNAEAARDAEADFRDESAQWSDAEWDAYEAQVNEWYMAEWDAEADFRAGMDGVMASKRRIEFVQTIHRSDGHTDVHSWPSLERAEQAYYAKRGMLPRGTITSRTVRKLVWELVSDEIVKDDTP